MSTESHLRSIDEKYAVSYAKKRVYRLTGTLGNLIPPDSEQLGNSDLKIAGVNSPTRTLFAIRSQRALHTLWAFHASYLNCMSAPQVQDVDLGFNGSNN